MEIPVNNSLNGLIGRFLAGPAILLGAVLAYAQVTGLSIPPLALAYAAYLFVPVSLLLLCRDSNGRSAPLWGIAAANLFWLPIELDLLPSLLVPPPDGFDVSQVVGIVAGFYLFLVAWPLAGIGCTFALEGRDFRFAGAAWAAYAVVALPIGFLTDFLTWRPDVDIAGLMATPVIIYMTTALPEEFLFRGVIQNLLTRCWGPRVGLWVAAIVFGLAHLPDLRYVILATLAGLGYGWVYARTGRDYRVGPDSHRGELDMEVALVVPMRMSSDKLSFSDVNSHGQNRGDMRSSSLDPELSHPARAVSIIAHKCPYGPRWKDGKRLA